MSPGWSGTLKATLARPPTRPKLWLVCSWAKPWYDAPEPSDTHTHICEPANIKLHEGVFADQIRNRLALS